MKKKFSWKGLLLSVIFVLVCFGLGILLGMMLSSGENADMPAEVYFTNLALALVSIYVWFALHIIIHESGHLVFGLLTGYKFSSFRVFSWMLMRDNGKFRIKKLHMPGTGGQCLMIPPELVDGKMPYMLYNLGGCIFNAAAAVLCLLLNVAFPHFLWVIGAFIGAVSAAMNGIPRHNGNVTNDGHNALSLGKDPAALQAFWVQMKLGEALSKDIRMKDMPEEWFQIPVDAQMRNSMLASVGYAACCRLLDEQKFAAFNALADHFLSMETGMVGIQKDALACDRITCALCGDGNREVVDRLLTDRLKQFMKVMKTNLSIIRTEYALALLLEQDEAKAQKCLATFEKIAKTHPYAGEVEGERELIALIQTKAANR